MLRLYVGKLGNLNEQCCQINDAWFDKYLDNIKFDDNIKKIIKLIDNVEYIGNKRVKSKYVRDIAISVKELSTGCKSVINIASFESKIFSIAECGDNALQVLFNFKRGNAYLPYFILPREFNNNIEVICNNKSLIIHNNNELENLLNDIFK